MSIGTAATARRRSRRRASVRETRTRIQELRIVAPWWSHPVWVILILPLPLALLAIFAGNAAYQQWEVPKYLTGDLPMILIIGLAAIALGMTLGSARSTGISTTLSPVDDLRRTFVSRCYKTLLWLTLIGYFVWAVSAVARGVRLTDLIEVVTLQPGAISGLKDNATPIGGITTLTQFGPLAAATGFLHYRYGGRARGIILIVALSAFRALFYAERLAIIEIAVPLVLMWAFTIRTKQLNSPLGRVLPLAPLFAAPILWALFAALEYTRSWVYYSQFTTLPYFEWVTNRLVGYYTTSYNNSALLASAATNEGIYPYFSVRFFWDAPGLSSILSPPNVAGTTPGSWWYSVLQRNGNPNFNNYGSFLTTYAEFGLIGMILFWVLTGLVLGLVYASLKRGNPIALVSYSVLFVGILELPRFVYWTQGRAFPVIIGCIVLAALYSKLENKQTRRRRTHHAVVQ